MASFTKKVEFSKTSGVAKEKMVHAVDFLEGIKEPTEEQYDEAGLKYFESILGLKRTDKDAERLQATIKAYCEKEKKVSKTSGKEYVDASFFGYKGRCALGAVFGDGNFQGLVYTLASAFDGKSQRERLLTYWTKNVPAGSMAKDEKKKK